MPEASEFGFHVRRVIKAQVSGKFKTAARLLTQVPEAWRAAVLHEIDKLLIATYRYYLETEGQEYAEEFLQNTRASPAVLEACLDENNL